MKQANFQTIKLSKGKHSSPEDGACVMELASMLAGEPFTDHPRSVSRPIASLLRTYNDMIGNKPRQDLYAYASRVVGTADCQQVEEARTRRLLEWGAQMREGHHTWSPFGRLRHRSVSPPPAGDGDVAARYALQAIRRLTSGTHAAVLSLVDELIELRSGGGGGGPFAEVPPELPRREQPLSLT
jgi:hypothetical protein